MVDICLALMLYTGTPMTHINVDTEEVKLTVRFTRFGYAVAGEHGVIIGKSYNEVMQKFCYPELNTELTNELIEIAQG